MMTMPCEQWSLCGVNFALELWPDVFQPTLTSELIAQTLEVQPGEVVIDLGCGSGCRPWIGREGLCFSALRQ